MKKFLSILLALALVLSLGTVAFATGGEPYTDHETVTLTKNYKLTNENTTSPAETFTFTDPVCKDVEDVAQGVDEADAPIPTIADVAFSEGAAGDPEQGTQTITIDLPEVNGNCLLVFTRIPLMKRPAPPLVWSTALRKSS